MFVKKNTMAAVVFSPCCSLDSSHGSQIVGSASSGTWHKQISNGIITGSSLCRFDTISLEATSRATMYHVAEGD